MSAIENVVPSSTLLATITQFLYQFRLRLISQLIEGISRVLQKLPKYFSADVILTAFPPLLPVWPVIFSLILNELVISLAVVKSAIPPSSFKAGSSL